MATLDAGEINEVLRGLPGWQVLNGALHRDLEFRDFSEAFGFITRVALIAEKLDHHPDWSNSWNSVSISIVSHAEGGITARCVDLATRTSGLLER